MSKMKVELYTKIIFQNPPKSTENLPLTAIGLGSDFGWHSK